jgi:hypothetical protein
MSDERKYMVCILQQVRREIRLMRFYVLFMLKQLVSGGWDGMRITEGFVKV